MTAKEYIQRSRELREKNPAQSPPDTIGKDEFKLWLTPLQAFNKLKRQWDEWTIKTTITGSIKDKLFVARAGLTIHSPGMSQEWRSERAIVPLSAWDDAKPHPHDQFWANGRMEIEVGDYRARGKIRCNDVRFDPIGIEDLIHREPEPELASGLDDGPPPKATRHNLPALNDEHLEDWLALFLRAYPNGSKQLGEESARGMFPNHSVDRQKVRDLMGQRPIGRPPKTNGKS